MLIQDEIATKVCLEYVWASKKALTGLLYHHQKLEESMGRPTKTKGVNHMQYGFDIAANEILFTQLHRKELNASIFSEECEEGWVEIGTGLDYIIVVDPFDQSTSATRTFRMAAMAICVTDGQYNFKACAIGDLNTHLVYFADEHGACMLTMDDRAELEFDKIQRNPVKPSAVEHIAQAFIVCPGAKSKRRHFVRKSAIIAKAAHWLNVDGVLNLGRLAAGYIDAYLDPSLGQPIYEIVCAELVCRAGGIVTDTNGLPFDLAAQVAMLRHEPKHRYCIVASCTKSLHGELLQLLEEDRKAGLLLVD